MPYAALDPDLHALTNPSADTLRHVARELAPDGLLILDYQLDPLEPLQAFDRLRVLKIQSGFQLREMASLAALTTLRQLMLSTPTGSDGSGRVIKVPSYAAPTSLTALERLMLLGVRPADLDLSSIAAMRQLREVEISGVKEFTLEQGPAWPPLFRTPAAARCSPTRLSPAGRRANAAAARWSCRRGRRRARGSFSVGPVTPLC
jgi:hypothetical protein